MVLVYINESQLTLDIWLLMTSSLFPLSPLSHPGNLIPKPRPSFGNRRKFKPQRTQPHPWPPNYHVTYLPQPSLHKPCSHCLETFPENLTVWVIRFLCVCVCACVCVSECVSLCVSVCTCVCVRISVCACVWCVCMCMHDCAHLCARVCSCVSVHVHL